MGATQKLAVKDASGKVIAIDVTRRFAPESWAAADHAETLLNAINPVGFVPFGDKGEPFDPPEEPWPSDKTATDYAPQAVSTEYAAGTVLPPNCDGDARYGQEPTQAGQVLAHAMHTAAEGGEGCDSVACSITQGVSD